LKAKDHSFARHLQAQQSAVALMMTDDDVVSRAAMLLETSRQAPPYKREAHHKSVYTARVRGLRATEVMQALRPLMSARRQQQIDAALAARSIQPYRIPYVTEVAEMVKLKATGVSRRDLAERYAVHPETINRLVGTYGRRDAAVAQAAGIEAAEDHLERAVGGDPGLAWLAGIIEGEGSLGANGTLSVQMTDEDVVQRVAAMFGKGVRQDRARRAHWAATWTTLITGRPAVQILEQIEGALGERRCRQVADMRSAVAGKRTYNRGVRRPVGDTKSAAGKRVGFVPPARMARNLEIARRLAAGERGPALAAEYGMTHQNVYFIGKKYRDLAACPRGEGSACKAEHAGSNPAAASS
jgi:hypothetical protein